MKKLPKTINCEKPPKKQAFAKEHKLSALVVMESIFRKWTAYRHTHASHKYSTNRGSGSKISPHSVSENVRTIQCIRQQVGRHIFSECIYRTFVKKLRCWKENNILQKSGKTLLNSLSFLRITDFSRYYFRQLSSFFLA